MQVYWPPELHDLWEGVLPCRDCWNDPKLDGRIQWTQYVPCKTIGILPPGRRSATYLILAAEPSGSQRVKDREREIAKQRPVNGVRNFNGTNEDLALQFALERWLIDRRRNESYYITDLAKCKVPTGDPAAATAERRYANCARWLEQELRLLRPRAIIAVGRRAFDGALEQRGPQWPDILEVSHYGKAGVGHWKRYLDDGWDTLVPVLSELEEFISERRRLSDNRPTRSRTNETHRWLLAMYRTQLGAIRRLLEARPPVSDGTKPLKVEGSRGMRFVPSSE